MDREDVLANAYIRGEVHWAALQAQPIVQRCITEAQRVCTFLDGKDRTLLEKYFIRAMQRWQRHKRHTLARSKQKAEARAREQAQDCAELQSQRIAMEVDPDTPEFVGCPAATATSAQSQLGLSEAQWTQVYENHIVPCIKRDGVLPHVYAGDGDFLLISALRANESVQQHITQAQKTCSFLLGKERSILEIHFMCAMQQWQRIQRRLQREKQKTLRVRRKRKNSAVDRQQAQLQWGPSGFSATRDDSEAGPVDAERSRVVSLADSAVAIQEETLDADMSDRCAKDPSPKLKKPRRYLPPGTAEAAMLGAEDDNRSLAQVSQVPSARSAAMNDNHDRHPTHYQAPRAPRTQRHTMGQSENLNIRAPVVPGTVSPEVASALAGIVPTEVLADPIRLPDYLQVLHDLASNCIPTTQWAHIIQGFHAQRDAVAHPQPHVQSKVSTSSLSTTRVVSETETLGSPSSKVSTASESIVYRPKSAASPLPTFMQPQRRLRSSDEEQAMHWPNSPAVSAKAVEKAKAVAAEAEQSDFPASLVSSRMPRRRKANNVAASSIPPVGHFLTQVPKRAPSQKHKRQTIVTEVIVLSSSPSITPPSVRQKERLDSAVLEVPTIAGSSVASVTFEAPRSNPTLPVSNTTQDNLPTSQLSMSELRPLPPRETQVLTLFVTSDFVPDSGAYIEVASLVDIRYPVTEGPLQSLSWDEFLRSLPPDFCPDTGSATILVSQPGRRRRHPVRDCTSLSYAVGDVRHFKPLCKQIAVHIASLKGEADLECARTLAEFAKGSR